ncbi:peptide chain release factor N(5)-glutamine methyltransferase [Labilibaculum sp. A4]|uniref:peptide chain release factor N(5)-glutamine methyltransferase n=1 Tax=Labilibaculum euxinus TaxID=2686357 RepID=UPI000F6162D5|nr:peptide chain release factor N(5)-glutamine methyltransferase [Labilibaculum euxinus]MDQ1770005.1 peptide chain release factor N(5)-glutamine methyltransferase [Labilibaculum euxinus]MWN77427.1 peptide chain release factor N(5)-glutamine methyltransferase [Labilibaculum euxinus]
MTPSNTIQSTINYIKKELAELYHARETESMAYILLEYVLNNSKSQIQLNRSENISDDDFKQIAAYTHELKTNKPIQYILGETEFYDLTFKVNKHTLIPRPETEELVHAIINENRQEGLHILDIGTGSGCIPISLAKNLKNAHVSSADISAEAIEKAKENAKLNQVDVHFFHRDILNWKNVDWDNFDIIVSNPPYVTEAEKSKMEKNVLDYEPHTALFVTDHDPLIFYRTISEMALLHLKKGGKLYFEINESLGNEMVELLEQKGFNSIRLRSDINGKNRMISAIKPQ